MSFDVYLHLFGGTRPEAAREAVAAVLGDLGATGPDEFGRYEVPVADLQMTRSTVGEPEPYHERVGAPGLDGQEEFDGCSFFLHAFSAGVAEIIFRIADAGGLTILAVGDSPPLVPPSADPAALPGDLPEPRRVTSAGELFTVLSAQYEAFARFRDRVVAAGAARRTAPGGVAAAIRNLAAKARLKGRTRPVDVEEIIIERRPPRRPQDPRSAPKG